MAPEEFTNIKHRIEQSTILSDEEKKEWLFLLPKMSPIQIKELDRILSVHPSKADAPQPPLKVRGGEGELSSIQSLSLERLRQAPSIYVYLEKVVEKIKAMTAAGIYTSEQIRLAFEGSPLYKAYLDDGLRGLSPSGSRVLTSEEFEALADFRTSLNQILR